VDSDAIVHIVFQLAY